MLVGVVPAAGYATRLQPLSGSKEVFPVSGRPVMDYLLDRMQIAGCRDIRVVTRPEKEDVRSHAQRRGVAVRLGYPSSVAESILTGIEGADDDDVVLFGFPDNVWEPEDGYVRLLEALDEQHDVVLGVFRAPEPERCDVVTLGDRGRITKIDVKPARPASSLIWGVGAARARALWGLEQADEPGVYFDSLCRTTEVRGIWLSDVCIDIGTKDALRRAEAFLERDSTA
jgi:glucose-1-phosphate thymidylyltransferase